MMTLPMVSAAVGAGRFEEVIRATDPEIVEEDLVQLVVVVLPGMHQARARSSRSSLSMTRDSRMISGRVPTIVITLSIRPPRARWAASSAPA